ncbi:hypothetical protein [Endozoicomonas sp. ISHI1]|uniref:hypothetical protein n=1 Tax=Endozoicomonas sp. ISHI1 TaxID=2825882 RepID=UPI00214945CB|nr:hypothetical protein [Endozoicomonas sp. ISHI1]
MNIQQIIRFHDENFFEGAVQLGWVQKRVSQAEQAAKAFVFHGPRYHGAGAAESDGIEGGYRLKDTASFVRDLLESMDAGLSGKDINPYWLAVAGYGSGKSHLALTTATLLSSPTSDTAREIIQQIKQADESLGVQVDNYLGKLNKPALILPLDGMSGFHLGNALSQAVFSQFKQLGIDADAIRNLSPRFKTASQFAERNFEVRKDVFSKHLPSLNIEQITERLNQNDEEIYSVVDEIYINANGSPIPVEGQESAQELIDTLSNVYCSEDGPFSQVIILFDEFGRYLEYAAEKPNLAGDSVLQQIFQGIQDNSSKTRFVGFIQYELKAYLKRFSGIDLRQLQRYVTRFDAADKWYLSSNLETIFAHMIGKDEQALDALWTQTQADSQAQISWERLSGNMPGFDRYPVWNDSDRFKDVIARGCWPLHPVAVWFLSRQRDVVQSRSALTFIRDIIERVADQSSQVDNTIRQVSVAELIINNMLPELVAAERETGGSTAETLQVLLDKFSSHLDEPKQNILAGVAALEKMCVGKKTKTVADSLLCEATALNQHQLEESLQSLSELGAVEWNQDLGQYELLSDGASRGQFQQWVRKQLASYSVNDIKNLFIQRAKLNIDSIQDVRSDFAQMNHINTHEWFFETSVAHTGNIESAIKNTFKDWSNAALPNEAKGKVIYLYLHNDDDLAEVQTKTINLMDEQLKALSLPKAPVWIIALNDRHNTIADHITRLHLFEEDISEADENRYRRFLPEDQRRSLQAIKEATEDAILEKNHWIAGFPEYPEGRRLSQIGTKVFQEIYPNVIVFPFDGFSSRGNGGLDVAKLSKALIAQQVNTAWLQTQERQLQNRTETVLRHAWQALSPSGKVHEPRHANVKLAYQWLEDRHKENPNLSLYNSYQALIAPPYGFNAASAGLFISLFLGISNPPRRIEHNGELISGTEWLNIVYKKTGTNKNFFQPAILTGSRVRFLSENSESRWRTLLNNWEAEQHYGKKVLFGKEAERLVQTDPMPESLEGTFRYLLDRTQEISAELIAAKTKLEQWERGLESAVRNESVSHAIKLAKNIYDSKNVMEDSGVWPEELIAECNTLLPIPLELIRQNIASWIPLRSCTEPAQVNEFREKNEKAARSLKELGFERESQALIRQVHSCIIRVENSLRYKTTLAESEDYPRQPAPNNSAPVRELRDEISRGRSLIENIQKASDALSVEEINARVAAIDGRIDKLEKAMSERRNELGSLYNEPSNEQELRDVLLKARRIQGIFVGTPDEMEVTELIVQIERLLADIDTWDTESSSPQRIQSMISKQIEQQLTEFNTFLEQDDYETFWSIEALYSTILSERVKAAARKSENWIQIRLLSDKELGEQSYEQCLNQKDELTRLPAFLADEDREKALALLSSIEQRISEFEEVKRKESATDWLNSLVKLEEIDSLGQFDIKKQLDMLKKLPDYLGKFEQSYAQELQQHLTKRLDRLSIDDIVERIHHLTDQQKHEILNQLKGMLHL